MGPAIDRDKIKNILVLKLRNIGDVLLTVPTIRAVRDTFPNAYIAALVNKGTEDMLTGNPLLDDVIVYNRKIKQMPLLDKLSSEAGFAKRLRSKHFNMTVDLTGGDRPAIYSYLSGARYRIGWNPKGKGFLGKSHLYTHLIDLPDNRCPVVLKDLSLVRHFGIDTENLAVNIFFSEGDRSYIDEILSRHELSSSPFIHIHPTSRWFFKCWTDEYMAKAIDFFECEIGIKVIVTCGPSKKEIDKVKSIIKNVQSKPINLAGSVNLKRSAALSQRATLFFGVDSAPMHIAAAVGTPVVALFGPSGAFNWGPWDSDEAAKGKGQKAKGKRQKKENRKRKTEKGVIDTTSISSIGYEQKNGNQSFGRHTVIQRDWDCVPCGKDGCAGSKRSKCLEDINVREVIEVLETKLLPVNEEVL
jgi:lipopolysaccharide heptosyltransferase III